MKKAAEAADYAHFFLREKVAFLVTL